ncbi:MAG: hypothetical protein K6B69_16935 [Lachnospiraceae bacterium]|nr:hypothetical protein [Lachnospiraceae bacterium]
MPKTIQLTTPKKRKLTSEQKKENRKRNFELERYGVTLGDITASREQNRFYLCFIRSLLIFMACFGLLGAMASSFGLPFSLPIVIIGLYALAFLTAFLYYNKVSFYIGYFVVFAGFIFFSFRFYWHINSGYQAFTNEVFNKYSDYFHLLATRESAEVIENRYLTVTAAMLFMGWFFSILLNISISGYMNLPMTFLLTFLPLQLPFYIDIVPPLPYLVLLISVYIAVAMLGRSGHFALPYRYDKTQFFDRKRRKKETRHTYLASSQGMLSISIYSVILASLFLLITGAIFSSDFNGKYISNKVKDTTDRFMKAAVQNGIYSLFDRYNAKGGLARGQLGGIGNVSPDFETDLVVRLVPYSSDTIYLKAYNGVTYENNTFHDYAYITENGATTQMNSISLRSRDAQGYTPQLPLSRDFSMDDLQANNNYYAKMWIHNVDGDKSYNYYPYYSFYDADPSRDTWHSSFMYYDNDDFVDARKMLDSTETMLSYAGEDKTNIYEVLYLPFSSAISYSPNPTMTCDYEEFVYDNYLQIPERLKPVLEEFCETAGLNRVDDLYPAHTENTEYAPEQIYTLPGSEAELEQYKMNQQYRLGVAAALKRYFAANFDYTMTPGTTPRDRDVVDYFLNNQKRGYCAHFASSATMLLRSMGIPTRYCEGYMLALTAVMDGKPISTDTENWAIGTDALAESGIVEVDLPDAAAHAWIEIYLDGYGWIPYEMTPPSTEDTSVSLDLYGLFSGLMTQTRRNTTTASSGDEGTTLEVADQIGNSIFAVLGGLRFLYRPFLILLSLLVLFLLCLPLARSLKDFLHIRRLCKAVQYDEALLYQYRRVLQTFIRRHQMSDRHPTLRDFDKWLESHQERFKDLQADEIYTLCESLQYAGFSKQKIDPVQYGAAAQILHKLARGMQRKKNKNIV